MPRRASLDGRFDAHIDGLQRELSALPRCDPGGVTIAPTFPVVRRADIGALDVSLSPDLAQQLRGAAARLGESPRLLAIDILQAVLGGDIVDAVLDRA